VLGRASLRCAVFSAALSVLALVGWTLQIAIFRQLLPGLPPMKANTAVCYLLVSLSLVAYTRFAAGSGVRRIAAAAAVVVVLVGAATLAEYAFGLRLGIDQWLIRDHVAPHLPYPGRPSANAALGFGLLGMGLLCWEVRLGKFWVTNGLAWLAAALGVLAVIGYTTGVESLITFTARQHIALNSAAALAVLSLGFLLARSDRGEMALLASGGQGGIVLRRLLPVAIVLPVALGMLTLVGRELGLFTAAVGEWLFASVVTIALAVLGWMIAGAVDCADAQRSRVEGVMRAVAETASDAIVTVNATGVITYANRALEIMFGYDSAVVGQPAAILFPDAEHEARRRRLANLLQLGDAEAIGRIGQLTGLRSDGREFPIELSRGVWEADGEPVVAAIIRDVSERQRAEQKLRGLLESAPDAIVVVNAEGEIVVANARVEAVFGYAREELVGQPVELLVPDRERQAHRAQRNPYFASLRTGHVVSDPHGRRKDGSEFPVEITLNPIQTDDGPLVAGAIRDVTDRREAEQATARLAAIVQSSADAIIGLTPEGTIESWNAGAERLYGYKAQEAIDQSSTILNPPEDAGKLQRVSAALAGDTVKFESDHLRRDGSPVEVGVTISPIRNGIGTITGVSCLSQDMSERKRAERELARLADAAEHGTDAVISIDLDARVRHWNRGAERLYGWSSEEAIGESLYELTAFTDEPHREIAKMLAGEDVYQVETRRRRKDGVIVDVLLTISPWLADGQVVGVTGIAIDLTERKRVEQVREQALADLEEAQRIAKLGSWSWDPSADRTSWSGQMYEIFDRDPRDGPATGEEFVAYVHPDDRGRLADGYGRVFGGGPGFELDYRIIAGAGELRVLHANGRKDPVHPGCYHGTVQDVTEARNAELATRDAEERFRRAFEDAPIGMAVISQDGLLEHANLALGAICGRLRDELEGLRLRELLHPADVESIGEALLALAGGDIDQLASELRIIPAAGSPITVSIHGTVVRYGAGQPDRLLCQFQDITERKRFESQLQFMAGHDPLTGLLNRRKFEAELDRHVAYVKRYGSEGALLMLDIDHFKAVNDTLGHNAGDALIVSIAGVLRQRVRASDVLARLGGDEFAVLLPKADHAEATQVARVLVDAVRTSPALLGGERKKVTTSIGVAMFDATNETLSSEAALIEADLAMYDAKEAGRDGYAFFTTSEHRTSRTKARLTWMARIEQALELDRFALVAQPILDLHTGQLCQHELLLRMLDEHDDMIPPAAFLYIAERFGLIPRLDEWVVTHAIALIDQHPDLRLHVNISGKSLGDQRLLQAIDERLRASRIDPTRLIFEVTETAAVANITHAQSFAQRLRDHGCRFALDDFGAGFGSFYYLKHLPFDYVKIDGEFVQHAINGHIDQLVIEAVVRIAQGLGKETIAEFVTNGKTQRMVARLGVDYAQGYHIGKPGPIPELLSNTRTRLS